MSVTWSTTVNEVVWTAVDFPTVTFETIITSGGGGGGGVTDHGALSGLADDDHTQYAKADGTRGAFASPAQGALADTALQSGSGFNTASGWLKLDGSATVPDILIPSSIARDSEVTSAANAAQAAAIAASQPLDSDLTAIAALATQALGRSLLTATDHAALMALIALVAGDIPNLAASQITSGTVATARLGSGTANSGTFLRGDQTYAAVPSSVPTSLLAYATDTYLLASRDLGVGHTATANGSIFTSSGMMRYYPLVVPQAMSVKALALWITGGNSGASAVWRAGLYADNGSGAPGSVLVDGGTASVNTTGLKELTFSPVTLAAGDRIWFCSGFQGLDTGSTNPSYSAVPTSTSAVAETTPQAATGMFGYYEKTGVTGALGANPAPTISRNTVNSCPNLWLKAA